MSICSRSSDVLSSPFMFSLSNRKSYEQCNNRSQRIFTFRPLADHRACREAGRSELTSLTADVIRCHVRSASGFTYLYRMTAWPCHGTHHDPQNYHTCHLRKCELVLAEDRRFDEVSR